MDWFTWLSRTNLDPSLVYEYSLTFTHNELGEDDIAYFSHEFLQSMGVSIAKHRLEILKLARSTKGKRRIRPVLWFKFAVKQTKDYLSKHIQALVHRDNSALVLAPPKRSHSLRWKVAMLQRSKRLKANAAKTERFAFRNDGPKFVSGNRILMLTNRSFDQSFGSSSSSRWDESEANGESGCINTAQSQDGEYSSGSIEEIKWDSMFKNLKPT